MDVCVCVCVCVCVWERERERDYGMEGGRFTDAVLYSLEIYRQEHAAEQCRLLKNIAPAWGAVILRYHVVSNLYKQ